MSARIALTSTAQFFRMSSYFSSACPLLGGLGLAGRLHASTVLTAAIVSFGFHVFSSITNDIRDRALDASDPRRGHMPVASGRVPVRFALATIALCSGTGLVVAARVGGVAAVSFYLAACGLVGTYNRFGKQIRAPFVGDLLCGGAFGVLVLLGASLSAQTAPGAPALALSVALYIALITGLYGPVRDYDNDRTHATRTTAGWLCGYCPRLPSVLPRRVSGVACMFQAATFTAFVAATGLASPALRGSMLVGTVMQAAAMAVAIAQAVWNVSVERQARLAVPVALLSLLSFSSPVLASSGPWLFGALLAVCTLGWFLSPAGRGLVYRHTSVDDVVGVAADWSL